MTSWLESIQADLDKINGEADGPGTDGCVHDHLIGEVDATDRKYWLLSAEYLRRSNAAANECAEEYAASGETEKVHRLAAEVRKFGDQSRNVLGIFWMSCHHRFPEMWRRLNIGMRKGWKIVWCEHQRQDMVVALDPRSVAAAMDHIIRQRAEAAGETAEKEFKKHH